METMEMALRTDQRDVSDDVIEKCITAKDALKLSKEVSGLSDKVFCQELQIDAGQWSRVWSAQAHFPEDKLIPFIKLCNNLIFLRWLALEFNMGLHVLKSELQRENEHLRKENEQKDLELDAIKKFMKEIGK